MKKYLIYTSFGLFGVLILLAFIGGPSNKSYAEDIELHNLQQLEEKAQAGDIDARLELLHFYSYDSSHRQDFKDRKIYWEQELEKIKSTDEYREALHNSVLKRSERRKQREKRLEETKKRVLDYQNKMKNKYADRKLNKEEEDAAFIGALDKLYNIKETYDWDETYIWRYRLTVNIETPEGVKSGSAIQEVIFPPPKEDVLENAYQAKARAEAIVIDLGERGQVFVLLPDRANADTQFKNLIRTTFPTVPKQNGPHFYEAKIKHYHNLRDVKDEIRPYLYPVFVNFKDLKNPETLELVYQRKAGSINDRRQVDVDRFEDIYGAGVKLKNITIEMTDDPVAWTLHETLPWLETIDKNKLMKIMWTYDKEADHKMNRVNPSGYDLFRQGYKDDHQAK